MLFITAIGQRWKRTAGAALTIVLLSAVAVVGLTLLGSEVFASWKATGNAEQALSSGGAFEGLLNFEAPAATVAQLKAKTEESESVLVKNWKYTFNPQPEPPGGLAALESLFAKNTFLDFAIVQANNPALNSSLNSNPPLNFIVMSGALSFFGTFLSKTYLPTVDTFLTSLINTLAPTNPILASILKSFLNTVNSTVVSIVSALQTLQTFINSFIPASFQPPPIPPASPSI